MNNPILVQIEPAQTMTLTDDIAEKLVRYIADNGLQPGDFLPSEKELTEALGVSRLPLREALSRLKVLGMITVRRGKSAKLRRFSAVLLFRYLSLLSGGPDHNLERATLEVRWILEPAVARLAAQRRDAETLARLEECIAGMRENLDHTAEFIRYDMEFHEWLARASGNSIFEMLIHTIQDVVSPMGWASPWTANSGQESLLQHQKILEAVSARNGEQAAQTMEDHLAETAADSLHLR